jgi:microcystin-dependent protein
MMEFLKFLFFTGFCSFLLINNGMVSSQSDGKISFKLVDITIDVEENDNQIHLQAFKSELNDGILDKHNVTEFKKLQWVSLGNPKFTITSNIRKKNKSQIFHFNHEGFYVFVEMLTNVHKQLIVNAIKEKKDASVKMNQITNMILSRFACSYSVSDGPRTYLITGEVGNFYEYPLKLMFATSIDSIERQIFQKILFSNQQEDADLNFKCEIEAGGTESLKNVLSINYEQINKLQITERLFGPASTTLVTRNQLSDLAMEMYSNLDIYEDYSLPFLEFKHEFVEGLIKQASSNAFNQMPIDVAIQGLSKYSTNFDEDLTADMIKKELKQKYEIKKLNNRTFIKLNEELSKSDKDDSTKAGSVNVKASGWGARGELDIKGEIKQLNEAAQSGKSLNEELRIINKEDSNDIQWEIVGERVIPKSISVAKLNKASFSKKLSFNRIRKQSLDALFKRKIILSTLKFSSRPLINKFPIGTIISIASEKILGFFKDGEGFDNYLGWYLCDGRNGSPNLGGRVLVGYDSKQNDYNEIGNTGGISHVRLTVDELPEHTHSDSGHSHNMSLVKDLIHVETFKKVFRQQLGKQNKPWIHIVGHNHQNEDSGKRIMKMRREMHMDPCGLGKCSNHEEKFIPEHQNTLTSYASISKTGGNKKHENRQPYYTAAYIIFLDI